MMKTVAHMLILEMLVGAGCLAQTKKTGDGGASSRPKLEPMPQSLEIRFALSAAPPHLRSDATTFLLDPAKGYERSYQGTNGVSCIVVRSDWQWSDKPFRVDGPEPVTMNMPHYMFYAPHLKDTDIGGNGFSQQYPFVLSMFPGRDDYIVLLVGKTEKEKILQNSKDLLAQLCSFRDYLCTTAATRVRTPIDQ